MTLIARVMNTTYADQTTLQPLFEVGYYEDDDPRNEPLPVIFVTKRVYPASQVESVPDFVEQLQTDGLAIYNQLEHSRAMTAALPIGAQVAITGS